ncbi:MAG: hypothetical protein WAV48_04530 [Candidatus Magasanikiibacteriota bacterium]
MMPGTISPTLETDGRVLSAEQMAAFGRLNLDFIGRQNGRASEPLYILCNDRECNNATYSFELFATPEEILHHVIHKRMEFRKEV